MRSTTLFSSANRKNRTVSHEQKSVAQANSGANQEEKKPTNIQQDPEQSNEEISARIPPTQIHSQKRKLPSINTENVFEICFPDPEERKKRIAASEKQFKKEINKFLKDNDQKFRDQMSEAGIPESQRQELFDKTNLEAQEKLFVLFKQNLVKNLTERHYQKAKHANPSDSTKNNNPH